MSLPIQIDWNDLIDPSITIALKKEFKHWAWLERYCLLCIQKEKKPIGLFLQGWQIRKSGEFTMEIVRKEIQIGQLPSEAVIREIEEASRKKLSYDDDSPKLSAEQLSEFKPVLDKYYKPKKEQITLKIDADVLAAYRSIGKGYQTKMNAVLRAYIFSPQMESDNGAGKC